MLRKYTIRISLFLWSLAIAIYFVKVWQTDGYTDFDVYYGASERMAHGMIDEIYSLADGSNPFRYAPIFLFIFKPLSFIPHKLSREIWFFFQLTCFGLGFTLIYQTFTALKKDAKWILAAGSLFVIRYVLDGLSIGQVTSLMFLGYAYALKSYVYPQPFQFGRVIAIPGLFKIGPLFTLSVWLTDGMKAAFKSAIGLISTFLFFHVVSVLIAFPIGKTELLWKSWWQIVIHDSDYYDSSHYGSQSLNSALLRYVKLGYLNLTQAQNIRLATAAVICTLICLFFVFRKPKDSSTRPLFYGLTVFPYIWFMPESFKYAFVTLLFPIVSLMSFTERKLITNIVLVLSLFLFALGGRDTCGATFFFWSQEVSLPFYMTVLLGSVSFLEAWKHSMPNSIKS